MLCYGNFWLSLIKKSVAVSKEWAVIYALYRGVRRLSSHPKKVVFFIVYLGTNCSPVLSTCRRDVSLVCLVVVVVLFFLNPVLQDIVDSPTGDEVEESLIGSVLIRVEVSHQVVKFLPVRILD